MVKITNGIDVFEVTSGAYDSIYRHQGYQIVSGNDDQDVFIPEGAIAGKEKSADEIFVEELEKKPVSQWSKDEVRRYAAARAIDLSGTKNVGEAKDIIKRAMSEEE